VGSRVEVTVSRGPRLIKVPLVANEPIAQAIATLRAAGLNVNEQIGPPFATKATTTNPQPGAEVAVGTAITLYVA
ncbi:MAG TPA: PASTA domain-containing protein, partial [Acidimicrobiales bacterium]|nr:PASTA domain-containing protein [Acidimicrobiales bacterium]